MPDDLGFSSAYSLQTPGLVEGFVYHRDTPSEILVVGLFHNGALAGFCSADAPTPTDLSTEDTPDACGFRFNLTRAAFHDEDELEIRVLNTRYAIAQLDLRREKAWRQRMDDLPLGEVRHAHGLTVTGILDDNVTRYPSYEILAFNGDDIVGRSRLYRWQHVGDPKNILGRRVGFELFIDADLADGVPRKLRIETSTGQPIQGSPIDFCAYPNVFREACAAVPGRATSRMADFALARLMENSVPLSACRELVDKKQLHLTRVLGKSGRHVILSSCGARLTRAGADALKRTTASLVYFDLMIETKDGDYPLLQPAYDHERHLEQGYVAFLFALEESLHTRATAAGATSPSEIALAACELLDWDEVEHCPVFGAKVAESAFDTVKAAHRQALTLHGHDIEAPTKDTDDTLFPSVHVRRNATDKAVSIIIPTRNQGAYLEACVSSLREQNAGFDLDIVIVDNGSHEQESLDLLDRLEDQGSRILEFDEGFNFSLINNLASEYAHHDQLCFLNNDVFFPQPGVLDELCNRLADPTAGAVGPLMVRASDIIQHGGVVLGPQYGAAHAFEDRMRQDAGYGELLRVAHECSAVTGAMLLTKRQHFDVLGGFDERLFPVNFNDVDYCLRLREAGYRIVFTPRCHIQHFESVSRGRENRSSSRNRMLREVQNLRERWGNIIRNDPFFHPLFSIDALPYRALKSRITDTSPRTRVVHRQATVPSWV